MTKTNTIDTWYIENSKKPLITPPTDNNWLNTGHSREYWLCEFAGRAMQSMTLAVHIDKTSRENVQALAKSVGHESVALAMAAEHHASCLVEQLESKLKGTK